MDTSKLLKTMIFEGMLDQLCQYSFRPYLIVNTKHPSYEGFGKGENSVTFCISANDVVNYRYENNILTFGASFGGIHHNQHIPLEAMVAIYAKEEPSLSVVLPACTDVQEEVAEVLEEVAEVMETRTVDNVVYHDFGRKPVTSDGPDAA